MLKFAPQSPKNLVPRVSSVVISKLLKILGLCGLQKGPEMVFGYEVFRVRDLALFEHAIALVLDQISGNVLLKRDLGWFLFRHGRGLASSQLRLLAAGLSHIRESAIGGRRGAFRFPIRGLAVCFVADRAEYREMQRVVPVRLR